jgi:fatty-acid desaturase
MIFVFGYLFYYISALIGISIGYHRYFTHNSFKTNKFFEIIFLFFGLVCGGRSALIWCAVHRYHHAHSDEKKDPHSPIHQGALKVIFSHWKVNYIPKKYIVSLMKNVRLRFFHKFGTYMYVLYGVITFLLGPNFFIIFFLSPLILSWLSFGLLNYFAHKSGSAADVPLMNILAPGEGWHKVHHDHPNRYSLSKWDPAGYVINIIKR